MNAVKITALVAAALVASAAALGAARQASLRQALTFHASFDGSLDAAHAAGNPKLMSAPTFGRRAEGTAGLPASGETKHAMNEGRFGDALRFTTRRKPAVFFEGGKNVAYQSANWNGTVSLWLKVDPATELEAGFCDPIQITPRAWNDAAFFVEFEKGPSAIPFRLGVYADLKVWNPANTRFEDIPPAARPLVTVEKPPFAGNKWTHIVFTFERFNTGQPNGIAHLYLDGKPAGDLTPRQQTFTWDEKTAINLGASYIGLFDELSIFNRALSAAEVATLYSLPRGVTGLLP